MKLALNMDQFFSEYFPIWMFFSSFLDNFFLMSLFSLPPTPSKNSKYDHLLDGKKDIKLIFLKPHYFKSQ